MAKNRWKQAGVIAAVVLVILGGAALSWSGEYLRRSLPASDSAEVRSFTGVIESISGVTAVVETDDLWDEYRGTVRVSVILDAETAGRAAVGDEILVTYTGPFMETSPLQVSGQQSAELVTPETDAAAAASGSEAGNLVPVSGEKDIQSVLEFLKSLEETKQGRGKKHHNDT